MNKLKKININGMSFPVDCSKNVITGKSPRVLEMTLTGQLEGSFDKLIINNVEYMQSKKLEDQIKKLKKYAFSKLFTVGRHIACCRECSSTAANVKSIKHRKWCTCGKKLKELNMEDNK